VSHVDIIIDDDRWNLTEDLLRSANELFQAVLEELEAVSEFSVNLLLTNDENIAILNSSFRDSLGPTNVLSFPQYDPSDIAKFLVCKIDTPSGYNETLLGDIAMSFDSAMRESSVFCVNFFDRCLHLFVHSVLHLLGMDHCDAMENIEIKILESYGIKNPYLEKEESL
jgi:probable rRNA maturation factor